MHQEQEVQPKTRLEILLAKLEPLNGMSERVLARRVLLPETHLEQFRQDALKQGQDFIQKATEKGTVYKYIPLGIIKVGILACQTYADDAKGTYYVLRQEGGIPAYLETNWDDLNKRLFTNYLTSAEIEEYRTLSLDEKVEKFRKYLIILLKNHPTMEDIARHILRISLSTLNGWCYKQELIKTGKVDIEGVTVNLPPSELERALVIRALRTQGYNMDQVRDILRYPEVPDRLKDRFPEVFIFFFGVELPK